MACERCLTGQTYTEATDTVCIACGWRVIGDPLPYPLLGDWWTKGRRQGRPLRQPKRIAKAKAKERAGWA